MYQEQYSSKGGPSTIKIEDGKAKWSLDLGGVEHTGEVDVEQAGGQEAALWQARRDIEATAANPPQAEAPSEAVVLTPEPAQVVSETTEDTESEGEDK